MKRRAQFIWTPDQPIDHEAYFRLVSREPLRREDCVNRWVLFRKRFTLSDTPQSAALNITCDGRYRLYVNGVPVARGPARASPQYMRVDNVDVKKNLQAGENVIAVLVHSPGVDLAWYETTKGAWQPVFGDGGLYADLSINSGGSAQQVISDATWKCLDAIAWNRNAPRSGWGQDFIEDFDAALMPDAWSIANFDDAHWPSAQEMQSQGDAGDVATGRGGHVPFPMLLPREIPPLTEKDVPPEEIAWTRAVNPRPDLPVDRQLYEEELSDAPEGMFKSVNGLTEKSPSAIVKTTERHDAAIMLAFSPYITGCPFIDIQARGGEVIEVAAAEALPGEFPGKGTHLSGLKMPNHLTGAHLFRYKAKPGRQRFEKFEWTAVRALQINVRNAPEGVIIHEVGVNAINYPALPEGAFECSDPLINNLWSVGRHTALQCMHDAFEDCPGREKRQWVGDGAVHIDIAEAAFGPSAYPLSRQFLRNAAESQRPDGLIQMFAPGDHRDHGVVIPDFTLHWIRGVKNYWFSSDDIDLAEQLFPAIEKALQWFSRLRRDNGLIVDIPYWHFIEWAHVDRSGASAPINALYCEALKSASHLAEALGYVRASSRYAEAAAITSEALNRNHWNENRRAYVDNIEDETGEQGLRVSQQSNALMIAFDIAPQEKWASIIETISDERSLKFTAAAPIFMNAPPFNEATDIVRANTFFCHFLYEAFARAGRFDLALDHMRDFYQPMLDAGATTLWESFEPSASLCHVFSATPVYQLLRHALGVQPAAPGFRKVRFAPLSVGLEFTKGIYPTPLGGIHVEWRRERGRIMLTVNAPAAIEIDLVVPVGFGLDSRHDEIENASRRVAATYVLHDGVA